MPRRLAKFALVGLGLVEIGFAAWVISGRLPRQAALAETALLGVMNGEGSRGADATFRRRRRWSQRTSRS